jgi:threonylcarbamoyladenosine tRNA methylthiotransferase MtaB
MFYNKIAQTGLLVCFYPLVVQYKQTFVLKYIHFEFYREKGAFMKKVAFYTLGCKVNQYETEAITEIFENSGYEVVNFEDKADVYVINTCTVTNLSDRKSRQMIRKAKKNNDEAIVAVIGCYAQTSPEEVGSIPGVNLIIGTQERRNIVNYIHRIEDSRGQLNIVDNIMNTRDFEELQIDLYKEKTRAFLKIQEGCNQFCAYCIIPYARGPIRSREPENVLNEVRKLAENGFKEVVLTGIHLASYGKDIKNTSLIGIIKDINEVPGIERIRIGSIEPNTITAEFIEVAKTLRKLCPHFHISLQSGCDDTLRRMNRKYSTAEYKSAIDNLRKNLSDVAITTDVIVGFPGETKEEFLKTLNYLKEISFAQMHIFKFSPRKGTPAATFKEQVQSEVKEDRSHMLLELSKENRKDFLNNYIGRTMSVLFEQEVSGKEGMIEGLTSNYIRVECSGTAELKGKIFDVRLDEIQEDYMHGSIIK